MIKTALSILFVCILFVSCNRPNIEEGEIIVQPDIVNNPVYKQLNKQKEPIDMTSYFDKKERPKTSDVSYRNNRNHDLIDTMSSKDYLCKAFYNNDTLIIRIGYNGMFGGDGFKIICKNSKFHILPYYFTDLIIEGKETITNYDINQHQLILNKNKYTLGDSIFGYINFNLVENEKTTFKFDKSATENQKITHVGKGYFRGKIEKQP